MKELKQLAKKWASKAAHEAAAAKEMTGITSRERAYEHSAGLLLRCSTELTQVLSSLESASSAPQTSDQS